MCLQCMTKSRTIRNNILPGWNLVRATETYSHPKGDEHWEAGAYGLVRCNDPDFIFKTPLTKEPSNKNIKNEALDEGWWKWMDECDKFDEELRGTIEASHALWKACSRVGYRQDRDGYLSYWLRRYLVKNLRRKSKKTS